MRCVLLIGFSFFLWSAIISWLRAVFLSITGYRKPGINVKEVFYSIPFFSFPFFLSYTFMIDFFFSDLSP